MTDLTQKGPTIDPAYIDKLLDTCKLHVGQPPGTTSTFVHVYLPGGFYLASGFSACVSPENFDAEMGFNIAREDAYRNAKKVLWQVEGYRLYCALQEQKQARQTLQ
jgi:hypothetical protein